MTRLVLTLMFLTVLYGCSAPEGAAEKDVAQEGEPMDIQTRTWRLDRLGDKVMPEGDKSPTLSLDPSSGRASGFAGCNRYFADYKLDGSSLTLGPVGATKRLCDKEAMAIEDAFLAALSGGTMQVSTAGETLTMSGADKQSLEFAIAKSDES